MFSICLSVHTQGEGIPVLGSFPGLWSQILFGGYPCPGQDWGNAHPRQVTPRVVHLVGFPAGGLSCSIEISLSQESTVSHICKSLLVIDTQVVFMTLSPWTLNNTISLNSIICLYSREEKYVHNSTQYQPLTILDCSLKMVWVGLRPFCDCNGIGTKCKRNMLYIQQN